MDNRKDTTTKRTSELLSKSRSRVRYCHVDHLLKSNVLPDENPSIGHDSKRGTGSADFFMPIDNDVEADAEPAITLVPRQSTRNRQPPRRLIEEINN